MIHFSIASASKHSIQLVYATGFRAVTPKMKRIQRDFQMNQTVSTHAKNATRSKNDWHDQQQKMFLRSLTFWKNQHRSIGFPE